MRELLTPRQVAQAIRVSESSIKRWCDRGVIPTRDPAGGHRRIPLSGFVAFLRAHRHELCDPAALGLSAEGRDLAVTTADLSHHLACALLGGDESRCREIGIELFLAEHPMSVICDDVIAPAFAQIGDQWACGDAEVYQERRGCRIAHRLLSDLREMLPPPSPRAPRAMGGTSAGDHYTLASAMVELVLQDVGWNAVALGTNLPFTTLHAALRDQRPNLFWLSTSHIADLDEFRRGYIHLSSSFGSDVAMVIGGRALDETLKASLPDAVCCDSMGELRDFADSRRQLLAGTGHERHGHAPVAVDVER